MPPGPDTERGSLVVAGLSARLMAESARRAGYEVFALDALGDRDTQQAAAAWHPIGTEAGVGLDAVRTLAALDAVHRRQPAMLGWVAGAGFEPLPELMAYAECRLPRLGTPLPALAALRDPGRFFAALAALDLPHPFTQRQRPEPPVGWLHKDFGGSGGWQVQPAEAAPAVPAPLAYYQQWAAGEPRSSLFVANGRTARLIGHQCQLVAPLGVRPWVWHGVIGPVTLPPAAQAVIERALAALVPHFGVCGLASLDYLLDGTTVRLLEVNPRPSASMALYDHEDAPSLMAAHVRACLQGDLPPNSASPAGPLRGTYLVWARRPCVLEANCLAYLQHSGWCHDLAAAPVSIRRYEPVCTVTAQAPDVASVRRMLARRVRQVHAWLGRAPATRRPFSFDTFALTP